MHPELDGGTLHIVHSLRGLFKISIQMYLEGALVLSREPEGASQRGSQSTCSCHLGYSYYGRRGGVPGSSPGEGGGFKGLEKVSQNLKPYDYRAVLFTGS